MILIISSGVDLRGFQNECKTTDAYWAYIRPSPKRAGVTPKPPLIAPLKPVDPPSS